MEMLLKHDLQLENISGQGYDGAAAMSGQYTDLQSRLMAENNIALYVHCHAHVLNLILVDTCSKNTPVRDFFGTVQSLYQPAQSAAPYSVYEGTGRYQYASTSYNETPIRYTVVM